MQKSHVSEDDCSLVAVVELECIADWKDGSDMFMYGRLSAPTLLEDHTKYRCFVSQSLTPQRV